MDDSIKVSTRFIVLVMCFFGCYVYLNEKISKPEFKNYVHKVFKPVLGNNTNHTLINMLNENTNAVSVGLSTSIVTLLSYVPQIIREPKAALYGVIGAGALGFAKYKLEWIDWGFFSVNKTNLTEQQEEIPIKKR